VYNGQKNSNIKSRRHSAQEQQHTWHSEQAHIMAYLRGFTGLPMKISATITQPVQLFMPQRAQKPTNN